MLIYNPIIKTSGQFADENGFIVCLPTRTILVVGAVLVLLTIIFIVFSKKYHDKGTKESD